MSSEEWKYISASTFCYKIADGTHDSPKRQEEGKKLITSKHIKERVIDFDSAYHISIEDYTKINLRSKVDQWDVLISMIGEYCGYCYVERNDEIDYAVKNVGIFKTGSKIKAEWIYYYLNSPEGRSVLASLRSGTSQPYISLGALRDLPIMIPKEEGTMKGIVNILSLLDDKIELNRQTNQTLEGIAQTLFQEMCVPKGDELPDGWRLGKLDDLIDTVSVTHKMKQEEIIFLNTSDILEGIVLNDSYSVVSTLPGQAKKSIKRYDILFSEIRPANKRYAFVNFDADDYVVSTKLMVLRSKGEISTYLIYCYLTSNDTLKQLQHLAETRSGTFPQITFNQLKDLEILIPVKAELDKLTTNIESIYETIFSNSKENQTLIALRDSLLPKLMKGEIEI